MKRTILRLRSGITLTSIIIFLVLITSTFTFSSDVFYQDFPLENSVSGTHWNSVNSNLQNIKNDGYGVVWLPFPVRVNPLKDIQDPYGLYDIGDTTIVGGTSTILGAKGELISLISNAHLMGVKVYLSVDLSRSDLGMDLTGDAIKTYLENWSAWIISKTGADGLVFDNAKNIPLELLLNMTAKSGVPCIADVDTDNVSILNNYVKKGMDVVDHYLYNDVKSAFSTNNSSSFERIHNGTFYHDASLNITGNSYLVESDLKDLARVFLILKDGTPSVFKPELGNAVMKKLLELREKYAYGPMRFRKKSRDYLVFERKGNLLVGINAGEKDQSVSISTAFYNTILKAVAGNGAEVQASKSGRVSITIPAGSWVAYTSKNEYRPTVSFTDLVNGGYVNTNPYEINLKTTGEVKRVYVRIDAGKWRKAELKTGTQGNWTYNWKGIDPGTHYIEAKAYGNGWKRSDTVSVRVIAINVPLSASYTLSFFTENTSKINSVDIAVNTKKVNISKTSYVIENGKRKYSLDVASQIGEAKQGIITFYNSSKKNSITIDNVSLYENNILAEHWPNTFNPDKNGSTFNYDLTKIKKEVNIVFPTSGMVWNARTIKVRIKADNPQDRVSLVVNGGVGIACVYEDGEFVVELTDMTNNSYTLRAVSEDSDGKITESAEINFTCDQASLDKKYFLTWEGYDWAVADEVEIKVNGKIISWEAPDNVNPKNNWVTFQVDVTEAIADSKSGDITFSDTYSFYRNYIKNIRLSGTGVQHLGTDREGPWQKKEIDIKSYGRKYSYKIKRDDSLVQSLTVSPDIFSPNGDGRRESTKISFVSLQRGAKYEVSIKDNNGTIAKTYSGKLKGRNTEVNLEWDGKNIAGVKCSDGKYMVTAKILKKHTKKKTEDTVSLILDTTAPEKVAGIKVVQTSTNITMSWQADNQADTLKYKITRDPVFPGSSYREVTASTNPSFIDTGLIIYQKYTYTIIAWDKAENEGTAATNLVKFGEIDEEVSPTNDTVINFMDMTLKIPAGAVTTNTKIQIKWVTNVWKVNHVKMMGKVFDFKPDGLKFNKASEITVKYDDTKIPKGFEEKHVFNYTWSNGKKPVNMYRVSIDTNKNEVVSKMFHFSGTGAGVMDLPSNPQAGGGVKTDLTKLAKANPLAGMNLIGAPSANNVGDLVSTYPIPLPKGTGGLTPQVSLVYNSSSPSGNCGVGWNLSAGSAIVRVNAKKRGLPKYNDTDIFMLNGQELVHIGGNKYRFRISGGAVVVFEKKYSSYEKFGMIIRYPYWEMKDAKGNVTIFGDNNVYFDSNTNTERGKNATVYKPTFLNLPGGYGYAWHIREMKDIYGNKVEYYYENHGNILYVKRITYAGGVRKVEFDWANSINSKFSYMSGFKITDSKILTKIKLFFNNKEVNQHKLNYQINGLVKKYYLNKIDFGFYNGYTTSIINSAHFEYEAITKGFSDKTSEWKVDGFSSCHNNIKTVIYDGKRAHTKVDTFDINGDGLPDYVRKNRDDASQRFNYYANTGTGFRQTVQHRYVPNFTYDGVRNDIAYVWRGKHTEVAPIDMNGDGFVDWVHKQRDMNYMEFYQNGKYGFDHSKKNWYVPNFEVQSDITYVYNGDHTEVTTKDMNGDGLPDRVFKHRSKDKNYFQIYFNNGNGFNNSMTRWYCPPIRVVSSYYDNTFYNDYSYHTSGGSSAATYTDMIDMNGDGLPDRVVKTKFNGFFHIYFNTGNGFDTSQVTKWYCPPIGDFKKQHLTYTTKYDDDSYTEVALMDMNGDGLPDRVFKRHGDSKFYIYLNTGTGFQHSVREEWNSPDIITPQFNLAHDLNYVHDKTHTEVSMKDMNGDGLIDRIIKHRSFPRFYIKFNKTKKHLLLNKVRNDIGGEYSISYTNTINTINMPFQKRVVEKIESKDTVTGFKKALKYKFENGKYDRNEKQFLGFEKMIVTDASGTFTETRFHNNDILRAGKSYYSITRNKEYRVLNRTIQLWSGVNLYNNKVFAIYKRVIRKGIYTGNGTSEIPLYETTKTIDYSHKGLNGLKGVYPYKETSVLGSRVSIKEIGYKSFVINGIPLYLPDDIQTKVNNITTSHEKLDYYNSGNKIAKVWKKHTKVLTKADTWLTTVYEYDDYGNIAKQTDARLNFITYEYDTLFHIYPIKEITTSVIGDTSTSKFNPTNGDIIQSDDDFGNTIRYEYDSMERLTRVTWNNNPITDIKYGVNGKKVSTETTTYFEDGKGVKKYVYIDGFGKTLQEKEAVFLDGIIKYISTGRFSRDEIGRVVKTGETFVSDNANFDPLNTMSWGKYTTNTFDNFGRNKSTEIYSSGDALISSVSSDSRIWLHGEHITSTDTLGRKKRIWKDRFGNVTNVIDDYLGKNIKITYNYDVLNRLTSTVESGGETTTITYDAMGQKLTVSTPDTGISKYGYNDYGDMLNQENANGQITRYYYDASGRLDRILYHDNKETTFIYGTSGNQKGQLEEERGIGYTNVLTYNQLGNVSKDTRIIDGKLYVMEQTYTIAGQIKSMKYPDGKEVHYTYNDTGDLDKVGNTAGGDQYLKHIYRNKDGFRTNVQYGNGTSTSYSYDPLKKTIKTIETKKDSNGEKLQSLTYNIDIMGNVKTITDGVNGGTTSYIYDSLNRLDTSTANGYSITSMNYTRTVTFTNNGNILTKSDVGSYSYQNGTHRVTQAGTYSFTYDSNGNMVTKQSNTALTRFQYNARDNLSMVTNDYIGDGGGKWARFTYDSGGQRIKKWSSAGNSSLYVNGYYTIKNGKYTNRHIYAGSERICTIVNDEPSYIHRDHINSGGVISTNGGNVGDRIAFSPYGQVIYQMNTNSMLEEKFTGQILDEETGLYYYNSRYYDPKIGVFISPDSIVPDPFDSQMLNRYMYVRGNPVKYTDPDGHHPLIAVGVGFAIGYLSHGAQTGEWGRTALAAGVKGAMAAHVGATFGGATAAIIGGPAGSTIGGIVGGAAGGAFGAGISGGNVGYGALAGLIGSGIGVLANQSGIPIIQEDFSSAVIGGAVGGGAGSAMAGGNFWEGFASGAAGAVGGYLGTAALGGLPDARKVAQKRQNAKNEEYASYHEENFYRGKELVKNLNTYVKGKPYVWGGGHRAAANYAGFDCSGGPIHIQRDKMGFKGISKGGMPAQSMFEQFPLTRTTLENMRPGDYIFYDYRIGYKANIMNHIAVYLGRINGKHMTFNAWINPYGNHHRSLKSLNLYGKNTFNAVVHYRRVNWMQMEVKYGW